MHVGLHEKLLKNFTQTSDVGTSAEYALFIVEGSVVISNTWESRGSSQNKIVAEMQLSHPLTMLLLNPCRGVCPLVLSTLEALKTDTEPCGVDVSLERGLEMADGRHSEQHSFCYAWSYKLLLAQWHVLF